MVCKNFLPFYRLSYFANRFFCCAEIFEFYVVLPVDCFSFVFYAFGIMPLKLLPRPVPMSFFLMFFLVVL